MVDIASLHFFYLFLPFFAAKVSLTMNVAGYPEFTGNLDALLREGSPTQEELEIEAFGIHTSFVTCTESLIFIEYRETSDRASRWGFHSTVATASVLPGIL